jgi:hypothetical protein
VSGVCSGVYAYGGGGCTTDTQFEELEGWHSSGLLTTRQGEGSEMQGGADWQWKLGVEEAMGQQLYRFEATVVKESQKRPSSVLAVFLIDEARHK